ncbi:choice-of-anchor A family protein [Asanoa sp. WMMD1127]|uniref:choice-of-anchor A family protein n=1 Tax=Asanoa sp. WMMD1127 TaxID=3016107 RepID=UPI00241777CB|nr:choice-of-anchor A family protein [Asanoa sp. WMMD1127]MDG4820997.1 choice-of-anchor A family protein [Asanoa sp. WMMD1127]
MARKASWVAAAAVGAVAAGASLWMLTPASATGPVNPIEGGLGFLVLVERDATLTGTESEGPMAIGGDVTFGPDYRIAAERGVRVGDRDSPLVIGGRALLDAPPVVDAGVLGKGDDGLVLRATDPAAPVPGDRKASLEAQDALDFAGVFATFRERSAQFDTCAQTVRLRNSGGGELARPVSTPGTKAYVSLTANQTNVLNLTGDEFNNLSDLTFNTQPSADTPVLVNVRTGADYEWRTTNFAGVGDTQAPYILMNFPDATAITQVGADTAEGTIYAPRAAFTDVNTANNEGNLVVSSYRHGTAATNGGETHDLPFNTTVQCGKAAAATPATAPPASVEPTAGLGLPTELPTLPTETGEPSTAAASPAAPSVTPPAATDPAPMDSGLPWAWLSEPPYPTIDPAPEPTTGGPVTEEPLPPVGEAPLLPGDEPVVGGDTGTVDVSPSATPSGAVASWSASPAASPSASTEPAVVANYGPLPGQGGAESGESLTRPSNVRLAIAGLSILVVSFALLLLGRRRKRRHAAH